METVVKHVAWLIGGWLMRRTALGHV